MHLLNFISWGRILRFIKIGSPQQCFRLPSPVSRRLLPPSVTFRHLRRLPLIGRTLPMPSALRSHFLSHFTVWLLHCLLWYCSLIPLLFTLVYCLFRV